MMIICDDDSDDDEIYERDLGADAYSSARLDLGDRREIGRMKDFLKWRLWKTFQNKLK